MIVFPSTSISLILGFPISKWIHKKERPLGFGEIGEASKLSAIYYLFTHNITAI